jgi:hypothetical protein
MTKEEIYDKIRQWEMDHGESFFDYFSGNTNVATYIGFLLGKGHSDFVNRLLEDEGSPMGKSLLFLDMNEAGEVFPEYDEEKFSEENYEKNLRLCAEFISLTDVYQKRFEEFLTEN